jgi:hypothetical protein
MSWQLVGISLTLLLWIAWFGRLKALLKHARDAVHRAECISFCAAAACLTLQLPSIREGVSGTLGVPHIGRLLGNLAGVYAAWAFSPCMIQLWGLSAKRGGILISAWLMRATSTALILLFALAPRPSNPRQYVATPFTIDDQSLAYTLVYMAYLGAIVFQMLILSLRCERSVGRSPLTPRRLRLQLHFQTGGWVAGVAFALHESAYALIRQQGLPYPPLNPAAVSSGLLAAAVIGVAGGDVHAPWHWLSQYRACRRLYPLWHLLREATPAIALTALFTPPTSARADALALDDPGLRLFRRVVEIRDGIVALRPYRDRGVANQAAELCRRAGLGERESRIVSEATVLAVAAHDKGAGVSTTQPADTADAPLLDEPVTFEEETAYLQRVAAAVHSSPIVATIVASQERGNELGRGVDDMAVTT